MYIYLFSWILCLSRFFICAFVDIAAICCMINTLNKQFSLGRLIKKMLFTYTYIYYLFKLINNKNNIISNFYLLLLIYYIQDLK